jgi:hypothetical protein
MSAEQVWDSMVTLAKGNLDSQIEADNTNLHQYLDDLSMFLNTIKEKGPEGLVEIAKKSQAGRAEMDKKIAELTAKAAQMKESGSDPQAAQRLAREAAQLRRGTSNDVLEAIVGEDRARDLRQGYKPQKAAQPKFDKTALASLSKEQRRDAMKMGGNLTLTARASELPSPAKPGHFLRTFGQSDRELIQNASDEASVPQALALLNGPASEVLNNPLSKLSQDLAKTATPQQRVDLIYLSFLSRLPTRDERTVLNQVIQERGDKAVDDVTHALLTGSQFLFIQ